MITSVKNLSPTSAELSVKLDEGDLSDIKRTVYNRLRPQVKAAGFRPGKAPDEIIEKELGQQVVQSEVLDAAVNRYYVLAVSSEKLKVIGQPEVKLQTFVPYTELTLTAETEIMPEIKLPDYKKFKVPIKLEPVSEDQIEAVLENIRQRLAKKTEVKREARNGDEVWVDFTGSDAAGKDIPGASGKDLPVRIGSKTFIPGFEDELEGLKPGDKKTFQLTFPKDYHARNLRGTKAKFEAKVNKVQELELPAPDDKFASQAGPFKTLAQLRADIKKQLEAESGEQAARDRREEAVRQLVGKTKMSLPPRLVERVLGSLKAEFERNVKQRGLEVDDVYREAGLTAEEYEKGELQPTAERRVKASLVLSQVAKQEDLSVSPEELEKALEALKQRYGKDETVADELDKPEVRQDIALQILTERTIDKLVEYASQQT